MEPQALLEVPPKKAPFFYLYSIYLSRPRESKTNGPKAQRPFRQHREAIGGKTAQRAANRG